MKQKVWLVMATDYWSYWKKPKVYVAEVYSSKESADKYLQSIRKHVHTIPDPTYRVVKEEYNAGSSYYVVTKHLSACAKTITVKQSFVIKGRIVQD